MSSVVRLLAGNPLLLLFVVAAIGYPVGQFRVAGTNLGVGAVLFAGLAIGALDPSLKLPEIVYLLGLVLFVYTVGLANGTSFVAALVSGRGLRVNALVILVIVVMAGLTFVAQRVLHLSAPMAAGMFAGNPDEYADARSGARASCVRPAPTARNRRRLLPDLPRRRVRHDRGADDRPAANPPPARRTSRSRAGITMVVARVNQPADATAEPLGEHGPRAALACVVRTPQARR